MGEQRLRQIRIKYQDPVSGGYDLESQDKGKKDWHMAAGLEIACFNVILRALFFNALLRKPQDDYLGLLKYITTRPMLFVWRRMDPDIGKLVRHNFASQKRQVDLLAGGEHLNLVTAQEMLKDSVRLNSLQREIFGSSFSTKSPEATLSLPAQLSELQVTSLGGQHMLFVRANRVINRLGTGSDLNDTKKLAQAIEDSKTLLLEEVQSSNDPQVRFQLHNNLAFLYDRISNKALAVQHRSIGEELKSMLDPSAIEQVEKFKTPWKTYFRDARRAKGEPINEAERLMVQLHERKTKLKAAEADPKADELTILSCVDELANTLRDLGRHKEAIVYYQRVIEGRQQLLPTNDDAILRVMFARSKLLSQLCKYDESIPCLRTLLSILATCDDQKFHYNVKGTLGLQILNSLEWSGKSIAAEVREELLKEARRVLEEVVKGMEELYEPGDVNIAIGISNLASLYAYEKDHKKAEVLFKTAMQMHLMRTTYVADQSLVWCQNSLAILWRDMEKFHDADTLHLSLIETCIEHYEIWHDITLTIMCAVHKLYTTMGDREKARSLILDYTSRFDAHLVEYVQKGSISTYEEQAAKYSLGLKLTSCELYENAIPVFLDLASAWRGQEARKEELIDLLTKLQSCYFSNRPPQFNKAFEVGTEIVDIHKNWKGAQHADTLDAIATKVVCLQKAGYMKEAIREQLALIDARKATSGADNNTTLVNISYLGAMYQENEEWREAIKTREEVYTTRRRMDSKSRETASALSHLAVAYADSGDYASASALREDEVCLWREIEGDEGSNTNLTLMELAFTLEKSKSYGQAMMSVDKVIAHHTKTVGPLHYSTLHAKIQKAVILRGEGNFDEAEVILHEILEARAEDRTKDTSYSRALASLSKIYEARGFPNRAIDCMSQAVEVCEALSGDLQPNLPEILHMGLIQLLIAAERWSKAKEVLEKALRHLRALHATASRIRKIENLNEMLRGIDAKIIEE